MAKFGTNLLTAGGTRLNPAVMADLVRQVAQLISGGAQVAVVTSGAVAAGRDRLGAAAKRPGPPTNVEHRQALAAIGQSHLMERYDALLRTHDLIAAQALLTHADLADRAGYLNARNTLTDLLRAGVVPIVNENDVIATEELRGGVFGENDSLSALVTNVIDADLLVLLSDVHGLFDRDPRSDPGAALIPEVTDVEATLRALDSAAPPPGASGKTATLADGRGRGGMRAKVEAARLASGVGATVVIAYGQEPDALLRIAAGERLGTRFQPRFDRMESRKRWLLAGLATSGRLAVDAGAVVALRSNGRSLLAAGIVRVDGAFARGDIVEVRDFDGQRVAVGMSNYAAADIGRIQGQRSDQIAEILGYEYGDEVIHRNNLALL